MVCASLSVHVRLQPGKRSVRWPTGFDSRSHRPAERPGLGCPEVDATQESDLNLAIFAVIAVAVGMLSGCGDVAQLTVADGTGALTDRGQQAPPRWMC